MTTPQAGERALSEAEVGELRRLWLESAHSLVSLPSDAEGTTAERIALEEAAVNALPALLAEREALMAENADLKACLGDAVGRKPGERYDDVKRERDALAAQLADEVKTRKDVSAALSTLRGNYDHLVKQTNETQAQIAEARAKLARFEEQTNVVTDADRERLAASREHNTPRANVEPRRDG